MRSIAAAVGREPSTISRELGRNGGREEYRAHRAEQRWHGTRRRPKPFRLETHRALRRVVEEKLAEDWSPEQIAGWLRLEHPNDPRWWVSPETIYQSLYVQGRNVLRKELTEHLRRGRAKRRSGPERRGRFHDMVMITDRPPEADDRAVPGHWEGDLILGAKAQSQVGMLTERASRYTLLFALPHNRTAETVRSEITKVIATLPQQLLRSLTWDQGKEMAQHLQLTIDTGVQIYFCDPASPWQRGTAETTVGLLRQYLPKDADLSVFTNEDLAVIADRINRRPRKTLQFQSPAQAYAQAIALR
jgi:IS30 family transposase